MFSRAVILAMTSLVLAPQAIAHAILMRSQPAAGSSVAEGKVDMSFVYNSRLDRDRSQLTLTRPDHSQVVLTIGDRGPPNVLDTTADLTATGRYVVRWQVLAIDGHITRGDVPFTVTGH